MNSRMNLYQYEGKIVRVIDTDGRAFTGIPVSFPHEYGYHEFNRDEESIRDCRPILHLRPFIFQTRIIQKKELAIVNNFG